MSEQYRVGDCGGDGRRGRRVSAFLEERRFPISKLLLLASARSAGKTMRFGERDVLVEELTEDSFANVDIAFFSAGGSISKKYAPIAARAGAVVVDNSSAFRMDPKVPLVIPEINPEAIAAHDGIIANPNCSTIIAIVPLWPIHKKNRHQAADRGDVSGGVGRGGGGDGRVARIDAGASGGSRIREHGVAASLRFQFVQS